MKKRLACIDYGTKRIGIALSDERQIIATALKTIDAKWRLEDTVKEILTALLPYDIDSIIVGLPIRLNGSYSHMTNEVNLFVELLKKATHHPVITWDERLTTCIAERTLKEGGLSRKARSKVIDGLSAVLILQSYLSQPVY